MLRPASSRSQAARCRASSRTFPRSPKNSSTDRWRCLRSRPPQPVTTEHAGIPLDERLDDVSRGGIQERRQFYSGFRDRLALIKPESLSPEERADYQIIQNQVKLELLDQRHIQDYRHNPTVYVEMIGNAIFDPFVLEYAPIDVRYRHIIQRLFRIPAFLEDARGMPAGFARALDQGRAGRK